MVVPSLENCHFQISKKNKIQSNLWQWQKGLLFFFSLLFCGLGDLEPPLALTIHSLNACKMQKLSPATQIISWFGSISSIYAIRISLESTKFSYLTL